LDSDFGMEVNRATAIAQTGQRTRRAERNEVKPNATSISAKHAEATSAHLADPWRQSRSVAAVQETASSRNTVPVVS
jgi:hypothetical protein